jgi:predicted secreted Zn-dependent protease
LHGSEFRICHRHGKTARAIYKSILSHSRKKDGFQTFATTEVKLTPKIKLVTSPQCKVTDARITARFVVHLPQLASEAALKPDLRRDWRNFAVELKHHEEHHRDIWLGCAANIAAASTGIPPGNCDSFTRQFEIRIKAADQACSAKNEAFDNEAQSRIPTFPFIQRAVLDR